jgi:vancomycin resistance protein YoaR
MNKNNLARQMAAITIALIVLSITPSHAQTSAVPNQPATQSPAMPTTFKPTESISTPLPTSYSHHYLSQHIQLSEQNKNFYATRQELGASFASGVSDFTVTTSVKFVVDQAVLTQFLRSIKPRIDSPAIPARPVLIMPLVHEVALTSDNVLRPAIIMPAQPAVTLLVPQSTAAVSDALIGAPLQLYIPLLVNVGQPPSKTSNLAGINSRLSHFVTHFDTGEVGRTQTVRRAIQLIDGTVLQPGQIFSINQTVGERTVARGFGVGKVFINGTMQDQVGGGMCQVATTLFNAALLANLNIIERHQHVRTVPYVPAGGDATVYYGEKDFQFQNNTTDPVYIYYKTYGRYAVCDLYGKGNPGVKVAVVTIPTKLGERYYKGLITRYVTVNGKTTTSFAAHSTYKWPPSLDYQR